MYRFGSRTLQLWRKEMPQASLYVISRKLLRRKHSVLFIIGIFIFYITSNGLPKRDEENKEVYEASRLRRDKKLSSSSRQRLRRMAITNNCRNRSVEEILPAGARQNGISRYMFRNLMVNDKYRFLYCQVPKVASSNWKRIILVLNGNISDPWKIRSAEVHNKTRRYFRYLSQYSPSEILVRLKTYTKFMFVRHPFERLVSAYRNKFVESYNMTFFMRIYGRYIIRKFRNFQDLQMKVSFSEFIRYVLEENDDVMNEHWKLYDDLCLPCLVYYDFIGHFEELAQDSSDILRILNVSNKVSFPMNISSDYKVATSVLAKQYFSELTINSKRKLYKKYQNDFKMFGYKMGPD